MRLNWKRSVSAALAVGVLCGTLPAVSAASTPSIEYDSFGNCAEITVTGIPADADHIHAVQIELTIKGSSPERFELAESLSNTEIRLNSNAKDTQEVYDVTLYMDRYSDLNTGSTAFLGTLFFPNGQAGTFEATGSLKLLDEKLRPLEGADKEGYFLNVPVTKQTASSDPGNTGNTGGNTGSSGGSGSAIVPATSEGNRISVSETGNGSVSLSSTTAKAGDRVTITVKPDAGYVLSSLTVKDEDGKEITLRDLGDGEYSFVMPDGKPTIEAVFVPADGNADFQPAAMPFTDVPATEWYYSAAEFVYRNGMMAGTSANAFSPNLPTNRAMIVSILYRLEGSPAAGASQFPDVPAGQYYTAAVSWAAANGIVSGYSTGNFQPNDGITREQLAAILYRYAQYRGYSTSATAELGQFGDAASVSKYAADSMRWAVGQGLISGTNRGLLNPAGGATRAEAASILMRFCQTLAGMS